MNAEFISEMKNLLDKVEKVRKAKEEYDRAVFVANRYAVTLAGIARNKGDEKAEECIRAIQDCILTVQESTD